MLQKSTWIDLFNDRLMTYRENGDLERLQVSRAGWRGQEDAQSHVQP